MSMVGQALVMVATRALRDQTWAGNRVFEQPINPVNMVLQGDAESGRPAIATYVEQVEGDPVRLEIQRGTQSVVMKILGYAPPRVRIAEDGETLEFNNDSAGLLLNLLQRQVLSSLQIGNGKWVELFRRFAVSCSNRKNRFLLIEFNDKVRLPSVELTLSLTTIPEPEVGHTLAGPWLRLDELLREEGEVEVADMFKGMVENPTDVPEWALLQARINLSDAAYLASGLKPLATDDNDEPVVLQEVDAPVHVSIPTPQVP